MQAQKQIPFSDRVARAMCHTALIFALALNPFTTVAIPALELSQASSEATTSINTTASGGKACPDYTGLRKNICYGPCCGVPWGPGGPICLALSAGAFRSALPYRFSSWLRSKETDAEMEGVDKQVLAFSGALFLSSAPLTFGGIALSWLLLVVCLV